MYDKRRLAEVRHLRHTGRNWLADRLGNGRFGRTTGRAERSHAVSRNRLPGTGTNGSPARVSASRKQAQATQPRIRIPNAERTETTRAALLKATIEAISRYGYQGATSVRIAELSGFTRGAQKHHFDSKAELVSAALVEVHERWLAESFPPLESREMGTVEGVVAALWAAIQSDLWIAGLELRVATRNDDDLRALLIPVERQIGRRAINYVIAALQRDSGTASEAKLRQLSDLTMNALRGMGLQRLLYADEIREKRQLRTIVEAIRSGLSEPRP
jgi:AcrR family transcriptional regulator